MQVICQKGTRQTRKKCGPSWDRGPRKARFNCWHRFHTSAWVMHPSFPLRGRWVRSAKSYKQAPSPSLVFLDSSSDETRLRTEVMHGSATHEKASKCFYMCKLRLQVFVQ